MLLYFVRHGQSQNNAIIARTGSRSGCVPDPDLTEVGYRQSTMLAEFLSQGALDLLSSEDAPFSSQSHSLTHIYCSLMLRAVATGTIIAETLSLPLLTWVDLHEEGGIYSLDEIAGKPSGLPGANRSYLQAHYPCLSIPENLTDRGWWNKPFESLEQRKTRAQRFIDELIQKHGNTDDQIVVVSHQGFYNRFLMALLRIPDQHDCFFTLNSCGTSRIGLHEGKINLSYLNRTDYLQGDLLTT
ncbi:Phosphoserine phosphatase 1 [Methylococcales bacterium]|nr:Phosphoserine phosphatase 1 [Methylococcales bacterium]